MIKQTAESGHVPLVVVYLVLLWKFLWGLNFTLLECPEQETFFLSPLGRGERP